MLSIKKMNKLDWVIILAIAVAFFAVLMIPDVMLAATTSQVNTKLKSATTAIQGVLTGVVVVIGVIACLKIVVKHLPDIDDPHVKNEMWKSVFGVLKAVGFAAAAVWVVPWIYSLFT